MKCFTGSLEGAPIPSGEMKAPISSSTYFVWVGSLFLLVLFASCSKKLPPSQTIEGQVFIVLKNGESLKLGATPVLLVDSSAAMAHVGAAKKESADELAIFSMQEDKATTEMLTQLKAQADLESQLKRSNEGLANVDAELKEIRGVVSEATSLQEQDKTGRAPQQYQVQNATLIDTISRIANAKITQLTARALIMRSNQTWCANQKTQCVIRINDMKAQIAMIQSKMKELAMPRPLLNRDWPAILQSTMTDADGKFSLNVPVGTNLMIVAFGRREIFGKQEEYLWTVPASTQPNVPILLNNANLFQSSKTDAP